MKLIDLTIGDCLDYRAKMSPEDIFIKYKDDTFSWNIVSEITNVLALFFIEKGIKKGDRVGILGVNSPSWVFSYLAVIKTGAVAVLINACCKEREINGFIKSTNMRCLLYTSGYNSFSYEDIIKNLKARKSNENVDFICVEKPSDEWRELIYNKGLILKKNIKLKLPKFNSSELASILFTSGTTGDFKGVKLSHYSMVNNSIAISENMRWSDEDCMCMAVPLFHCFGVTVCLISSLIAGFKLVVLEKYKTYDVCSIIQNERCTIFNGVPSMFLAMINNEKLKEYDLSSLKSGIIAGSPIYKDDFINICNTLKISKLQTSYGLTETSPCVTISDYDALVDKKALSVGKPIEHVHIKIVDIFTGIECSENVEGEIYVKGYNVTMGYIGTEGEEYSAVDSDSWFKTGDIGYLDDDGQLHIVCRKKNIIIVGGENVSPNEIVKLIKEVTVKKEVFVLGIKCGVMQEEIVACIEGKEDFEEIESVKMHLGENLSDYKIPTQFIYLERFPKNSTGKIDEKRIKELVHTKINASMMLTKC